MSDTLDPESIARALEMVRGGERVCLSSVGGKWSKTLAYRADQFWFDVFDEGAHFDSVITEQQALEALATEPDAVRTLLARPAWRHFFRVFVEGDRAEARAALDATRGLPGGPESHRFVYEAFLDWPERKPSATTRERLKQVAEGGLATRAFSAAGYAEDDALANKKVIEYLTFLGEIAYWPRWIYEQRADCYERLGDLQAALDDCLREQKFNKTKRLATRIRELRAALKHP